MDDIVTRLRICRLETTTGDLCVEAADEIARLREERYQWFAVAKQLREAMYAIHQIEEAVNEYLRVRGRLEDPRDFIPEATDRGLFDHPFDHDGVRGE